MSVNVVNQVASLEIETQIALLSKMRDGKISFPLLQEAGGNIAVLVQHADTMHDQKRDLTTATMFMWENTTPNASIQVKTFKEFSDLPLHERIWRYVEFQKKIADCATERSPIVTEFYDRATSDATYQSAAYLIVRLFINSISTIPNFTIQERLQLFEQLKIAPNTKQIFPNAKLHEAVALFQRSHRTMTTEVSVDKEFYFRYLVCQQFAALIEELKK